MALREVLAHFGFTFDRGQLAQAAAGVEGVKSAAREAGGKAGLGALADGLKGWLALATGGAFIAFTTEIKEQAAELMDLSEQTGMATDELQAWTLQAQLGGASAGDFVTGLRKVARELATGADEAGQQSKLFKQLKIDTKNADGSQRDLSAVLPEIAERFKTLGTGAEKTALATQIFGRAGGKLVPILSKGAEGVAEMKKQLDELGGGFSKEAIERADEYDDNLIKLNFSFRALKSIIGVQVFPVIADLLGVITKTGAGVTAWVKETTFLSSAVKVLIGLVGVKLLAALAPFLLPGLKFVAIFLAVDDLIAFLTGKKSVIGDILDSWFGPGSAAAAQKWCASVGAAALELINGSLLLLKLAFTDDAKEAEKIGDAFMRSTNKIGDAVDWVVDKLKTLKDALTSLDTLKEGAIQGIEAIGIAIGKATGNDALVAKIDHGRQVRADERAGEAVKAAGIQKSGSTYAGSAGEKKFDALASQFAPVPLAQPIAPTQVNIPVNVTQDLRGVDAKTAATIKKATQEGVALGIADYRSAMQSLEQRAGK